MAITNMSIDPETGEIVIETDDATFAVSTTDGKPLNQKNLLEKKVSNYGSADPHGIVIRTGQQVSDIICLSTISGAKVEELQKVFKEIRERLLSMLDVIICLWREIDRCNQEFVLEDGPIRLPQVNNLRDRAESFLLNGKKATIEASRILEVFFDYKGAGSNYDLHLKWAKERFGPSHSLVKVLEYNIDGDHWIKNLGDMRNGLEHRSDKLWVKIQNIAYSQEHKKLILPSWSSNSEPEPYDMLGTMEIMLNNIIVLCEDLLAESINETRSMEFCLVGRVPIENRKDNVGKRLKIVMPSGDLNEIFSKKKQDKCS